MIGATSSGHRFGGLALYLVFGRSGKEVDRVAWTSARNLPTDEPDLAAQLMQATSESSVRVQQPVYHLTLSFDPSDPVDQQRMERAADRVLNALGLAGHQALLVAHRDREHAHVHLMVNRVHPETGVAWERWQDRPQIEKELRAIERDLGLRQVPGRLYREPGIDVPERSLRTRGEEYALARTGETPFSDHVRKLAPEFRAAQGWSDLDETLRAHGLRLEPKGQGLVITDGTHQVQASRVGREFSLSRLEQKFELPYPGLGPRQPGRDVDPTIRTIVRDVRQHTEVTRHREEYDRASANAQEAAQRAHTVRQTVEEWTRDLDHLKSDLRRAYVDPAAARDGLVSHLRSAGMERTASVLRTQPETFGALRSEDRKAVLGLVTVSDTSQARREAGHLVDAVRQLDQLEKRIREQLSITDPSLPRPLIDRAIENAATAYKEAQARVDELKKIGDGLPSLKHVERAIGDLAQALEPREIRTLRLFLTDPQALLVSKLRGVAMDLLLGRDRSHGIER